LHNCRFPGLGDVGKSAQAKTRQKCCTVMLTIIEGSIWRYGRVTVVRMIGYCVQLTFLLNTPGKPLTETCLTRLTSAKDLPCQPSHGLTNQAWVSERMRANTPKAFRHDQLENSDKLLLRWRRVLPLAKEYFRFMGSILRPCQKPTSYRDHQSTLASGGLARSCHGRVGAVVE
jgi:hypothetical protein